MEQSEKIESEFECLICMDLLVEPITTLCGHTFCRLCLAEYIKINKSCPLCRKGIFQSVESLSKNIVLDNIIRKKFPEKYSKRLNELSLALEKINKEVAGKHEDIPSLFLNKTYIWPNSIKEIKIINEPPALNISNLRTLQLASVQMSLVAIIPTGFNRNVNGLISCICEIQEDRQEHNEDHSVTYIYKLKGIKRIKLTSVRVINGIFFSSGDIIIDTPIVEEENKTQVIAKLKDIKNFKDAILRDMPISTLMNIQRIFGEAPTIPFNVKDYSVNKIEAASFYYLNMLKNENKRNYYDKTDALERINFIHEEFKDKMKFSGNMSLPFLIFDLEGLDYTKYSIKNFLIIIGVVLLLAAIITSQAFQGNQGNVYYYNN